MVLSNVEIQAEIAQKRLVFDPPITNPGDRIDSSTVDLLLHQDLILLPPRPLPGVTIVPSDDEVQVMQLLSNNGEHRSIGEHPYRMEPHRLVIGKTLEKVTLPNHLAAWADVTIALMAKAHWPGLDSPSISRRQRCWPGLRGGFFWKCTMWGHSILNWRRG